MSKSIEAQNRLILAVALSSIARDDASAAKSVGGEKKKKKKKKQLSTGCGGVRQEVSADRGLQRE